MGVVRRLLGPARLVEGGADRGQSRIDTPTGTVPAGRVTIAGVAWAPDRGISKVEVGIDDDWHEAQLSTPISQATWVQWVYPWDATPGHRVQVRATDGSGAVQEKIPSRPAPDGARGWHTVDVNVGGPRARVAPRLGIESGHAATALHLRPAGPIRRRHDRRAGRPDLLPRRPARAGASYRSCWRRCRSRSLAERLGALLDELDVRGIAAAEESAALARSPDGAVDDEPLDEPVNEAFRAGSLTLGWDGSAERVLVEARAQDEDGEAIDPDDDDEEDEDGPDLLRVRIAASAARSFVARAATIVAAGEPPCPLCGARSMPGPHLPAAQRPLRELGRGARQRVRARSAARRRDRGRRAHPRLEQQRTLRHGDAAVPGSRRTSTRSSRRSTSRPSVNGRSTTPDGTLTRREVAAYLVSEASGWDLVPPTILRDGPFGEGMVQAFIEPDATVDVIGWINDDDPRLRRMAAFDAAVNNTDRKGGHILPVDGGRHVYGVDHGVCFSVTPKLRRPVGVARRAVAARRTGGTRADPAASRRALEVRASVAAEQGRGPRDDPARRCLFARRCSPYPPRPPSRRRCLAADRTGRCVRRGHEKTRRTGRPPGRSKLDGVRRGRTAT